MSKDRCELDEELARMTNDQLEHVKSLIEVILRERDAVPVEQQAAAPSSGEVWGKLVSSLQSSGTEFVQLVVMTPFRETVTLEVRMVGNTPARQ